MLLNKAITGSILLAGITILGFSNFKNSESADEWTPDTYVYKALAELGDKKPVFYIENIDPQKVKQGREIIMHGRTEETNGGKSKYVSLYYVCTNCHNAVTEDPVLTSHDPQVRLKYAEENDLPFMQGSTFYGVVNRESWYNDDYYKKYGDLVKAAQNDIRGAIQLCATECSKGRYLEQWEEEAILHYYYSISYKMSDIGFASADLNEMNDRKKNSEYHGEIIKTIKSKYALKSPATFIEPPYESVSTLSAGNADNGKLIYELSCQSCHKPYGVSDVVFEDSKLQFKKFEKDFEKNSWWLYSIIRHGTYGYPGHDPYMPLYTAERMSDQQVEDLRAYFIKEANK